MSKTSINRLKITFLEWSTKFTVNFIKRELNSFNSFLTGNLESQLYFFWQYIRGPYIEIDKVEKLLQRQLNGRSRSKYMVQFEGGYPTSAHVLINSFEDLDFEDCYTIMNFSEILIYNNDDSTWTSQNAESVIKIIKNNFEFEGSKISIRKRIKDNTLFLKTKVS